MIETSEKTNDGNVGVNELFQIAMKVERNASDFYRKAAHLYDSGRVSELFMGLHSWKCEHLSVIEAIYREMIQTSWDCGKYVPGKMETPESVLMAGLAVFGIHPNPSDELSGSEDCIQAMDLAVRKEKDTIVFFTGLKGFMRDPSEHHNVDRIIGEETRQINHLAQARQQLLHAKTAKTLGGAGRSRKLCIQCGNLACSGNEYDLLLAT